MLKSARAFGTFQAVVDIDADGLVPVAVVRGVDGELARLGWHSHAFGREPEIAGASVEGEDVRAVADRKDECRVRAVERVTGGELTDARL
jgi:hypothetical protein